MKLKQVVLGILILACGYSSGQDKIILKIATLAPQRSLWIKELQSMSKRIRSKTKGAVRIRVYAGGIAGDEEQVLNKINKGTLQGAAFTSKGLGQIAPAIRIMEIPYFYSSFAQWRFVFNKLKIDFAQQFSAKGFTVLGWGQAGAIHFFSVVPVSDLQSQKVKIAIYSGDTLVQNYFKEIPITGISIKPKEIKTSLQNETIEGFYSSPYYLILKGLHTQVRYATEHNITHAIGALVIKKSVFDDIPGKYQKVIKKEALKFSKNVALKMQKENAASLKILKNVYKIRMVSGSPRWVKNSKKIADKAAKKQIDKLYTANFFATVNDLMRQYKVQLERK